MRLLRNPDSRTALAALIDSQRASRLSGWQSEAVGLLSSTVPDFWFIYLWFLGLPVGWLAVAALVLAGMLAGAALQLRV